MTRFIRLTVLIVALFSDVIRAGDYADNCPVHDCRQDVSCPHGFAVDQNGCLTCECVFRPPIGCEAILCVQGSQCRKVVRGCEHSHFKHGCDPVVSYECVPICPLLRCRECASGNVIDSNGCRTCACNDPCEGISCPAGQTCVKTTDASRYRCEHNQCTCPPRKLSTIKSLLCMKVCHMVCHKGYKCCPDNFGCVKCHRCY